MTDEQLTPEAHAKILKEAYGIDLDPALAVDCRIALSVGFLYINRDAKKATFCGPTSKGVELTDDEWLAIFRKVGQIGPALEEGGYKVNY